MLKQRQNKGDTFMGIWELLTALSSLSSLIFVVVIGQSGPGSFFSFTLLIGDSCGGLAEGHP